MKYLQSKRSGFTIIEVTVAVAIVGILASLVTINFSQSRKNARDGIRKTDAPAILTAVSQFTIANGSSLIAMHGADTRPLSCTIPNNDPDVLATGQGCVGASGRGYGKINAKGITDGAAQAIGRGGSGTRVYPENGSIVDALVSGGYFDTKPVDPLSKNSNPDDIAVRDYVLIRACPNGEQHIGARGQLFAVWTLVENRLTTSDKESIKKLPGFPSVKGSNTYLYDFAAGPNLSTGNTAFDTTAFGVGNASAVGAITSAENACASGA